MVVFPLTAELWAKNMKDKLVSGISFFYRYSLLLLLPFAFIVFAFAELIISLLFTAQYIPAANSLRVLIIGTLFYFMAQINFSIFSGIGKPDVVAKITIGGAVLNIILNIILIPHFGISGAALATGVGYFIMAIMSTIMLRKYITIQLPIIHWIKTIIFSLISLGIVYWLKSVLRMEVFLEAGIIIVIIVIIYALLSYVTKQIDIPEIKGIIKSMKKSSVRD